MQFGEKFRWDVKLLQLRCLKHVNVTMEPNSNSAIPRQMVRQQNLKHEETTAVTASFLEFRTPEEIISYNTERTQPSSLFSIGQWNPFSSGLL